MWCFRQSNNVFVLCSLLLIAGFVLELRVLYNNHTKHLRIQEYSKTINEVREQMMAVEKVANDTSILMNSLKKRLKSVKAKNTKFKN